MGLDSVEIVIATEEAFGVTLTDSEASECNTPRGVIELVWSKLKHTDDKACHSQRAFHLVRNALMELFGVSRDAIRPSSPIKAIIPDTNHKSSWTQLKVALHARTWPPLCRPVWLRQLITALAFITVLAVFLLIRHQAPNFNWIASFLAGVVVAIFVNWLACLFTESYRNQIPVYGGCVKDLIPYAQTSDNLEWTREEVARIFREITIEQLGIKESIYTEDSRFIEDLGMD